MGGVEPCEQCGLPHVNSRGRPSCIRHSNGRLRPEIKGKPCRQPKMRGQDVCRNHGGNSPQALRKAEERVMQAEAAAFAATLRDPVAGEDQDPAEIIYESIRVQYRVTAYFWARVIELQPDAYRWGMVREKVGGDDGGITYEPRADAWYELWREARRERDRLCVEALKLGLEERRVRLAEQEADRLVTAIDALVRDLGFDPTDPKTAGVVERHLRAVA